jgi:hypothetical protein
MTDDELNEPVVLNEDDWRETTELEAMIEDEPTLLCTCCRPARPITEAQARDLPADDALGWIHEHDASEALTIHAHQDRASSDADGPHEDHVVTRPNSTIRVYSEETKGSPNLVEYAFRRKTVQWMVDHQSVGGVLIIEDHGAYWRTPTDEGYSAVEVTWCTDPSCAYQGGWQRDLFAEQMGF